MRRITWFRWAGTLLLAGLVAGVWATGPAVAQEPHADPGLAGDADENPYTTRFDRRMGERIFLRQCSRCHGQDAKGSDETGAPDLTLGRFSNASSPAGIFDVIRNGVDGTAMIPVAPTVTDENIWQLVTYIDSLSTNPMDIDLPGSAAAGRQVFNGKGDCASCHMVNGEGARLGPDLSRIGEQRDPVELRSDLIAPNADVAARWWTMTVTRQDGSVVEGFRMGEDTFTLRVMDQEENLWSFTKRDVRSYERSQESTMPSYEQTLTASEIDDLVAYLFSLRREGNS